MPMGLLECAVSVELLLVVFRASWGYTFNRGETRRRFLSVFEERRKMLAPEDLRHPASPEFGLECPMSSPSYLLY